MKQQTTCENMTRGRRGRNRGVVVGQRGHHLLDARLAEHVMVGGHHGDVEPEQVLHFLPLERSVTQCRFHVATHCRKIGMLHLHFVEKRLSELKVVVTYCLKLAVE